MINKSMNIRELFEAPRDELEDQLPPEPVADLEPELELAPEPDEDVATRELGDDTAGRIKAGVVRLERTIGDSGAAPTQVLNGLYNLSQGLPIRGIEAQSVARLSHALLQALNDPVSVSLLKRAFKHNQ